MEKIKIRANGADYDVEAGKSVAELVEGFGLNPRRCLVELNGSVLRFEDFGRVTLKDGDALEIMSLVAGG